VPRSYIRLRFSESNQDPGDPIGIIHINPHQVSHTGLHPITDGYKELRPQYYPAAQMFMTTLTLIKNVS